MRRTGTPKLRAYISAAGVALVAALVLGRPELAAVAAPFVLFLVMGLALAPDPDYRTRVSLERPTAIEGELVELRVHLDCVRPADGLDIEAVLPPGLTAEPAHVTSPRLRAGGHQVFAIPLRCSRWGAYVIGDLALRARDRLGLVRFDARPAARNTLKVYPSAEGLRTLARPARTLQFVGSLVSREQGEGIELAEVRPFRPGDRVRSMNWRAGARRGGLWVTDRHPERNADVVIFLDAFTEVSSVDGSSLDLAIRAAASVAEAHLAVRDRVGFVSFGGGLRWLVPGSGWRQRYRIVDALLDTQIMLSWAWKGIDVIPARTLPARALVIALTPLLDERTIQALFDMRARGFDMVVLEIPPERFLAPARTDAERLARRIWALERDGLRRRFRRLGVATGVWREDGSLEELMGEVGAFRRSALAARA
jgi:uncharacterized protein (DUF58 family)